MRAGFIHKGIIMYDYVLCILTYHIWRVIKNVRVSFTKERYKVSQTHGLQNRELFIIMSNNKSSNNDR